MNVNILIYLRFFTEKGEKSVTVFVIPSHIIPCIECKTIFFSVTLVGLSRKPVCHLKTKHNVTRSRV